MQRTLSKKEREEARKKITAYHQKKLDEMIEEVYKSILDHKDGKISAFDVDHAIHVYHQRSQELFAFINAFFPSSSQLPILLEMVEKEEHGEWKWEPKK
jgi:hypothetical protein